MFLFMAYKDSSICELHARKRKRREKVGFTNFMLAKERERERESSWHIKAAAFANCMLVKERKRRENFGFVNCMLVKGQQVRFSDVFLPLLFVQSKSETFTSFLKLSSRIVVNKHAGLKFIFTSSFLPVAEYPSLRTQY